MVIIMIMMIPTPLSLPACMCGVAYGSACTGTACGKSLKHIIIGLVPWIFIENRNFCLCLWHTELIIGMGLAEQRQHLMRKQNWRQTQVTCVASSRRWCTGEVSRNEQKWKHKTQNTKTKMKQNIKHTKSTNQTQRKVTCAASRWCSRWVWTQVEIQAGTKEGRASQTETRDMFLGSVDWPSFFWSHLKIKACVAAIEDPCGQACDSTTLITISIQKARAA